MWQLWLQSCNTTSYQCWIRIWPQRPLSRLEFYQHLLCADNNTYSVVSQLLDGAISRCVGAGCLGGWSFWQPKYLYLCICVFAYLRICVIAYLCICVFAYLCICVYVYLWQFILLVGCCLGGWSFWQPKHSWAASATNEKRLSRENESKQVKV